MSTGNSSSKMTSNAITEVSQVPEELLCKYIHACHILHNHGLVDAYGHISVRLSPSTFLMSRYMAPPLVSSRKDLVVYKVEDGEAVAADAPRGFSERFIHSEVYKDYPETQSVLHSHCLDVVPFSISSVPLQACFHRAGFLGTAVPVWDVAGVYRENPSYNQDMKVTNTKLGSDLAKSLGQAVDGQPTYPIVLMRGHGFVATSDSLEMTVLRGIYTAQNAKVQMAATGLGGQVRVLAEREGRETGKTGVVKPWPLWVAEVEDKSIYRNELSRKD